MPRFDPHHGSSIESPILTDEPIHLLGPDEWAETFGDRPWVYTQKSDGTVTKVYRSYGDYCND